MHRLIDAIKSGDAELIEQQLGFCKGWGGGPLAAAALVAEAWIEARQGAVTRRAKPSSSKGSEKTAEISAVSDEAPSSLPPIC